MSDDVRRDPYSEPIRQGDRTFHVRYRADRAENPEFRAIVDQVPRIGDRDEQKRLYCRGIARVVAAWDVTDGDGRPVPTTEAGIGARPEGLLRLALHGCAAHARRLAQDAAMRGASGHTSPLREQEECWGAAARVRAGRRRHSSCTSRVGTCAIGTATISRGNGCGAAPIIG
jgi:hypothetical protein